MNQLNQKNLYILVSLSTIFQLYRGGHFIGSVGFMGFGGGNWRKSPTAVANYWQTLSHNVVSNTPRYEQNSNSQI